MIHPDWQERVQKFNREYEAERERAQEARERQFLTPAFRERMRSQESQPAVHHAQPAQAQRRPEPSSYSVKFQRSADGKIDGDSVQIHRIEAGGA